MSSEKFLNESKELINYVNNSKGEVSKENENSIVELLKLASSRNLDKVILSHYIDITKVIQKIEAYNLTQKTKSGKIDVIADYLNEKEAKLNYIIPRTRSKKKLLKYRKQLDEIQKMRKMDFTSLIEKCGATKETVDEEFLKISEKIINSDTYTEGTIIAGGTIGSATGNGFFAKDDLNVINEPNVLLALEILNGNNENYNKLKKIDDLNTLEKKLSNPTNILSLMYTYENYMVKLDKLDKITASTNAVKSNKIKDIINKKQNYEMQNSYQIIKDQVEKEVDKMRGIVGRNSNDFRLFLESNYSTNPAVNDFVSSTIEIMSSNYYLKTKLTNHTDSVRKIINEETLKKDVEKYVKEKMVAIEKEKQSIERTIPDKLKKAEIKHMGVLKYYGNGRIGIPDKEDCFLSTKINLELLLKVNEIHKEYKKDLVKTNLSELEEKEFERKLIYNVEEVSRSR